MYDVFQTDRLIDMWLTEDIGYCDLTAQVMIEANETGAFFMNAREDLIVAGIDVAARVFKRYDPTLEVVVRVKDGDHVKKGAVLLDVRGNARSVLTAERTANGSSLPKATWRRSSDANFNRRAQGLCLAAPSSLEFIADNRAPKSRCATRYASETAATAFLLIGWGISNFKRSISSPDVSRLA